MSAGCYAAAVKGALAVIGAFEHGASRDCCLLAVMRDLKLVGLLFGLITCHDSSVVQSTASQ